MSENQYLEIIDGKIDVVTNLIEQQTKSGVFFDGFTKQVLEKINNKLDTLSGMETNDLITYLTKEIKNSLEERHLMVQERLDGVQGQISAIQSNLVDSLKSPEIAAIFTKLSDTVLDFSRNLNSQTKYFNSTVEDIQKEIAKVNVDEKFIAQTNSIRLDIERYKIDVADVVDSINSNFSSIKELLAEDKNAQTLVALASDISILQNGLNDIVSVVTVIEDKQTDFISSIKDIASMVNVEDVKLGVSSIIAEMQALKDSLKILVNKSDIEYINEKITSAINSIIELKDYTSLTDNENKETIKKYFDELNLLLSAHISKDESEFIKNKLEYIESKLVSGNENILEEVKCIIPALSSLSTTENIKELAQKTADVVNDLSKQINDKIAEKTIDFEQKLDSLKIILSDIHKALDTIPVQSDSSDKIDILKSEVSKIADYVFNVADKSNEDTKSSVAEIKKHLETVATQLTEKIYSLDTFANFVQNKNNENETRLEELRDFSQKLITLISALNIEVGLKHENIKQLLEENQTEIKEKLENNVKELTTTTIDSTNKILANLEQQDTNIKTLEDKIDSSRNEIEENIKLSTDINSNIDNLEEKINALAITQTSTTTQIVDTISEQENFIRELETKVLLASDSTVENIKVVDTVNNTVEELGKKIENLSMASNSIAYNVAKQNNMLDGIESRIALNANSIVEKAHYEMDEKLNVITQTCGLVNAQVNEILSQQESTLDNLNTKIVMVANSLVENNITATDINSNISKINEQLTEADSQRKNTKEDILAKISDVMTSLGEKLSQSFTQRNEAKEEIISSVKNSNKEVSSKLDDASIKAEEIKENITQNLGTSFAQVSEKLAQIHTQNTKAEENISQNIETSFTQISEKLSQNNIKNDEFKENVNQILGTSFAQISEKLSQGDIKNDEFKENLKIELEKTISEITNKLLKLDTENTALRTHLLSAFEKTTKTINDANEVQTKNIKENFALLQGDFTKNLIEEIALDDLKIEISQDIAIYAVSLKEKIDETIELMSNNKDFLATVSANNSTNIMDRIVEIKNDLSEIKLGNASGMVVAEIRRVGEKIEGWSNDILDTIADEVKDSFSENIKLISETVQDNIAVIKDDIQELVIKLSDVNSITLEVKNALGDALDSYLDNFYAKFDDLSDEIKKHIDTNTEKLSTTIQEYQKQLTSLTDIDLSDYQEETKKFVEEQIEILKEKIDELKEIIPTETQDETENTPDVINEELKDAINSSTDNINKRLEVLRDILLSEVPSNDFLEENFEDIRIALNEINDKTNNIDNIQNTLDEINKKIDNIDDLQNTLDGIDKKTNNIDDLQNTLYEISRKTDNIDDVKITLDEICDKTDNINNVINTLGEINEKTNDLTEVKNALIKIEENANKFDNVQNILDEINFKTNDFANVVKTENASLKDVIIRYQSEINALSSLDASTTSKDETTKEFIKDELSQLKEQFVRNLTSVFENISFIEESEEIQNAILDNADVIKNEIMQLKNDIVANSNSTYSADQKFEKLKSILESITTGDVSGSDKYIYTLPDVEMDIAKMRMAISEVSDLIKQNREDGFDVAERLNAVDDIREDISSISKRTNKLILTSDDSNKFLRENINDFKDILDAIAKKCNKIDSSQLNQHIVDVKSLVMSGLKSDKILNEAFMHLAEWIDDSAKSMNTISSQVEVNKYTLSAVKDDIAKIEAKTDELALLKDAVSELAIKLDKKPDMDYSKSLYDIEYGLDRIADKLDVQEMKIKALEKKVETLSTPQGASDETNSLLEFIASQVTAANENSRNNRLLLQKVSMLEKQMSRFETSIAKITQFVDDSN